MWTEEIYDCELTEVIWPRTASAAERLWSNPLDELKFLRFNSVVERLKGYNVSGYKTGYETIKLVDLSFLISLGFLIFLYASIKLF